MKIETYANTAGLDRVPAAERYSLYRATHQRLLREDEDYHRHFNRYLSSVIVAAIVWLAFRQQRYMNERIGSALQTQAC